MVETVVMSRKDKDFELIQDILSGKCKLAHQAHNELYNHYRPYFMSYFLKNTWDRCVSEDLATETLSKAFLAIDKFDSTYAFSTWLKRIARNLLIDYKRRQKDKETFSLNKDENEDGPQFELEEKDLNPLDLLQRKDNHRVLLEKMGKLEEKYREIIRLKFFDELSYEEIAHTLEMPIGTVKIHLYRAKEKLRHIYLIQ